MLNHNQKENIAKMYSELALARNLVAAMRSSVFFKSGDVDPVTLQIVGLQDKLEEVLRTGELPPVEPLFMFNPR